MPRMRMMRRDGRNPYGSRGGYVTSRRGRRDRAGEDYARQYATRNDYAEYDTRRSDMAYNEQDMARNRRDYEYDRQSDMGYDDIDMRRRRNARGQYMSDRAYENEDYGLHEERGFIPVEAMGYFTGYYGGGEDYARGGRRDYGDYDYGYDMRGRYDYGYDYAGDYGEKLTKDELESFKKKLLKEVDENEKQFFTKERISQKAKQMGVEMKDYNEEELVVATAMVYTDYCKTAKKYIGNNMDFYIELARDWLEDKDTAVKGGEKLAIYYDCIVSGEDD